MHVIVSVRHNIVSIQEDGADCATCHVARNARGPVNLRLQVSYPLLIYRSRLAVSAYRRLHLTCVFLLIVKHVYRNGKQWIKSVCLSTSSKRPNQFVQFDTLQCDLSSVCRFTCINSLIHRGATWRKNFLPRDTMLACPSVCLPVISRYCIKLTEHKTTHTTPHNVYPGTLFWHKRCW